MPILAFTTSVASMVQKESVYAGTTESDYIDTYMKEGLTTRNSDTSQSERVLYFDALPDSWWLSGSFYNSATGVNSGLDFLLLGDGTDSLFKIVTNYDGGNYLDFQWHNGTEYITVASMDEDTVDFLENLVRVDVEFSYGTDGYIKIYINRQEEFSYSADTTTSTITPTQLELKGVASTSASYWSGVFLSDEDSTLITPVQYELTSDGTFSNDFTNSYTYLSAIGETGDNYSVESSAAGDASTYMFADRSSEIDGGTVVGLGLFCRAKTQEAVSADQFRFISHDGTNTAYSDYIEMDQYITPYQAIFDTAPDGSAWTLSGISTQEFGFEVSENG